MPKQDAHQLHSPIEAALEERRTHRSEGLHGDRRYVLEVKGRRVFYKTSGESALLARVKKLEFDSILKKVYRQVPALMYRDFAAAGSWQKEADTIVAWRGAGIAAPEVVGLTARGVAYGYINGVAYKKILSGANRPRALDRLLETYHAIRQFARSQNRVDLLHSDCHLRNFLYDLDAHVAVAIDPAVRFLPSISFESADASLNLFLAFSFCTLDTDASSKLRYLEQFADSFDVVEREALLALNGEIPHYARRYFLVREALLRGLIGGERTNILARYSPEHVQMINRVFRSARSRRREKQTRDAGSRTAQAGGSE
jgi:hypothetical protein